MEKGYIWQGEYGKRSHLKPLFKELLKEQDTSSLEMMAIFVNNSERYQVFRLLIS